MQRWYPFQGWRLTTFQALVLVIFIGFGLRMVQLQVTEYDLYQAAANENRLSQLPLAAPRGVMFDRYNLPIAINVPAFNVTIVPAQLPDTQEETLSIYNRLSALTEVPPTRTVADASGQRVRSIEELVEEGRGLAPYRAVIIAQDVPQAAAMQIMEERITLPGVDVQVASVRQYPTGALTSAIVGYMGPIPPEQQLELLELGYNPAYDRIGYAGMELYLEPLLSGQRGRVVSEVDVAGRVLQEIERVNPQPGINVQLTIDSQLQQAAEEALANRIDQLNAENGRIVSETGVVVAMDPRTGEILAMVSYPSYDNSRFARSIDVDYYLDVAADPLTPLVNHATQSLYPPGSIWKVLTAVGVLQENVIDQYSLLNDPGDLILPNQYAPNDTTRGQRFVCWLDQGHGNLDMRGALAQSCDVYFYQVGGGNPEVSSQVLARNGLGINGLFRYSTMFGIGSLQGVELPFENAGRMPDADWKRRLLGENWSTGDTYNAAFGQGYVNVTPIQLINSIAAVANGGTLYQPTIIRELTDADGNVVRPFEPQVLRTINLDEIRAGAPVRLLMLEDMIMNGSSSLACTCERTSEWYNPARCNPETYTNQVNINPDAFGVPEMVSYTVHVPFQYNFTDNFCNEIRFDETYRPPFVETENIFAAQEGMRLTVTLGTGQAANLSYVPVAGKTGTAEYCDEIARPLGLCRPGNWPAHAWFTAYAPYGDNPEILVQAFVYNGGEGSAVALPVVVQTMEAYFRLQNERAAAAGAPQELSVPPSSSTTPATLAPAAPVDDVAPVPVTGG
ncbi:MAG: penicillin-binding protein 2 [Pleurocapsa minor GSE-CHR-MK-17-07R]|jgi:penicillin-binding protein 2|nr:penicillin-binding protein 2 [Pleurocapsa minor GSE-CHR-MK 17-07R]